MSYLRNLAERTANPSAVVRPRLPGPFEPAPAIAAWIPDVQSAEPLAEEAARPSARLARSPERPQPPPQSLPNVQAPDSREPPAEFPKPKAAPPFHRLPMQPAPPADLASQSTTPPVSPPPRDALPDFPPRPAAPIQEPRADRHAGIPSTMPPTPAIPERLVRPSPPAGRHAPHTGEEAPLREFRPPRPAQRAHPAEDAEMAGEVRHNSPSGTHTETGSDRDVTQPRPAPPETSRNAERHPAPLRPIPAIQPPISRIESAGPDTVEIHIGSIEVRAVPPPPKPRAAPAPRLPSPRLSLDEYLRTHATKRGRS